MIRAVIDTNVIVAAMMSPHSDSATVKTISAIVDGRVEALVTDEILSEYQDVLSRTKFGFPQDKIAKILELFGRTGKMVCPTHYDAPMIDENDRVFYEVALAEPDAHLVTGNLKHYPISTIVVTPAQFCELLGI